MEFTLKCIATENVNAQTGGPYPDDTWQVRAALYELAVPVSYAALSTTKKAALERWFKDVYANNLQPKLTEVCLPILCHYNLSEGGVNLMDTNYNFGFPAPTTPTPVAGDNTYDEFGVTYGKGFLPAGLMLNQAEFSIGFINTKAGGTGRAYAMYGGVYLGRTANGSPFTASLTVNGTIRPTIAGQALGIGMLQGTVDKANNISYIRANGINSAIADLTGQTISTTPIAMILGSGDTITTFIATHPVGFYYKSLPFTLSEAAIFETISTTLINALLAA